MGGSASMRLPCVSSRKQLPHQQPLMSESSRPPPLPDHLLKDDDDDLFVSAIEVSCSRRKQESNCCSPEQHLEAGDLGSG